MNLYQAKKTARKVSLKRKSLRYVIRESFEDYYDCSEYDLETFFLGARIITCYENGTESEPY